MRDRIVKGIRDSGTRKHLLQKRQLTLQAAVDICRSCEAASAKMKSIDDSVHKVHKVNKSFSRGDTRPTRRHRETAYDVQR